MDIEGRDSFVGAWLKGGGRCLGRRRGGLEGRKEKVPLIEGGGVPGDGVLCKIFGRGARGCLRLRIRNSFAGSAGHVISLGGVTASSAGIALALTHFW